MGLIAGVGDFGLTELRDETLQYRNEAQNILDSFEESRTITTIAGVNIPSNSVVALIDNKAYLFDSTNDEHFNSQCGFVLSSVSTNESVIVYISGTITLNESILELNTKYFSGDNGNLIDFVPENFGIQSVGYSLSTTKLVLDFSERFLKNKIPESYSNKSTDINLGESDILYPTQNAVKIYVDTLLLTITNNVLFIWSLFTGFSIEQLRNLSNTQLLLVQTFYCNETGKEDKWYYDSTDTTSVDNLGTVLVTTSGKRIKRKITTNYLKYSWFDDGNTTDNTEAFNNLNDACYLLNKSLLLPKDGTIIVNQKFLIYNNIIGQDCLIKLKNNSTITNGDPILYLSANNLNIIRFTLDGNYLNNLGNSTNGILGIRANQIKHLKLGKVKIINTRQRALTIQNSPYLTIEDCIIDTCGRYGTEMPSPQSDRIGVLIDNNTAVKGSEFYMGSESIIKNTTIKNSGLDGLVVGVGLKVKDCIFSGNGAELTNFYDGGAGIYTRPPQNILNGEINGLEVTGCIANNNTGIGIDIGNNAYSTNNCISTNITISNNFCYDNYSDGIAIGSAENVNIINNICYNNGVRALYFDGQVNKRRIGIGINTVPPFANKNILIENNTCYDSRASGSKTQQYGIYIDSNNEASGAENFIIRNNNLLNNNLGSILLPVNNKPVISSSVFNFSNNAGDTFFTIVPTTNSTVSPVNSHIYLNPSTAINITGLDKSIVNTIITIENISIYNVTLINSSSFKLLGNSNIILTQNKAAKFILCYETNSFIWKQINTDNEVVTKILTSDNTYSGSNIFSKNTVIGSVLDSTTNLKVDANITGSPSSNGVYVRGFIQPDVTISAYLFRTALKTADNLTIGSAVHYLATQGSLGASPSIGEQVGFDANSTLATGTSVYGFRASLVAGSNIWNLYAGGTAKNYLRGNLIIGSSSADNGEALQVAGNINLTSAGNKLKIATGLNASIGNATLVSGVATINTTASTTNSLVWIQTKSLNGGQPAHDYNYDVSTNGVLIITAKNNTGVTDVTCTSIVSYIIIN